MSEHDWTQEKDVRRIAREEIASLAGMMLSRLQHEAPTRSIERNLTVELLMGLWGEALSDFSGRTGGGQEPGQGS